MRTQILEGKTGLENLTSITRLLPKERQDENGF